MTRGKKELDLELSIGGKGALRGALTPEDLADLADLMKGMKSFDPSLQNIQMIGSIRPGSAITGMVAPHPEGMAGIRPPRDAAKEYFRDCGFDPDIGWTWGENQRNALGRLTKRGCILGVNVAPSHPNDKPYRAKFGQVEYERFSSLIAAEPEWKDIKGKLLEIDFKDRTFEVHTAHGVMTCGFPKDYTDDRFDGLARRVVLARVFCRPKPKQGSWKAEACMSVLSAPQPQELLSTSYPQGVHPPKRPMAGGFSLDQFAPSLDAGAGESLEQFLHDFEGE